MKVNTAIIWEKYPGKGHIKVANGKNLGGTVMMGDGTHEAIILGNLPFTGGDICHMTLVVETEGDENTATVSITDTEKPFEFCVKDVLDTGEMLIEDCGVKVTASIDVWSSL